MKSIAALPARDRRELFTEAASRLGIGSSVIIEKDFWVCWVLNRLFASGDTPWPDMVFKGGTSLSKAYGVIERFSEDIDLSLGRSLFDFMSDTEFAALGTARRQKAIDGLIAQGGAFIREALADSIDGDFHDGLHDVREPWTLRRRDANDVRGDQTLTFEYPRSLPSKAYGVGAYVRPAILLEFGVRADKWPTDRRAIRPYAAEAFPETFPDAVTVVSALSVERTFWEKATILHAEYHRDPSKSQPERLSRHYYDMAMLASSEYAHAAIQNAELRVAVVEHKTLFFPARWARYDLAAPGTFRLVPSRNHARELERDFSQGREMLFGDVPEWASILAELDALEGRINASPRL